MRALTHWQWILIQKTQARATHSPTLALVGLSFKSWRRLVAPVPMRWALSLGALRLQPLAGPFMKPSRLDGLSFKPMLQLAPRGALFTQPSHRALEHAFLITGLQRFGEALTGYSFNLLIFKNVLATASPR